MKVSVVIPCYNSAAYIKECLESVRAQTADVTQIICVDDGSTDETLNRLHSFDDPRMVVVSQTNNGASAARNRGMALATGEYIQFLDSDDLLLPDKIGHQLRLIKAAATQPDIVVAKEIYRMANGQDIIYHNFTGDHWYDLACSQLGDTCSNLWRKAFLQEIGGWNETLSSSQEMDLLFRSLRHHATILHDERPLTIVRQRLSGSVSTANKLKTALNLYRNRQQALLYYGSLPSPATRTIDRLNAAMLNSLLVIKPLDKILYRSLLQQDFTKRQILGNPLISIKMKIIFCIF
jgi:hypothetical protein